MWYGQTDHAQVLEPGQVLVNGGELGESDSWTDLLGLFDDVKQSVMTADDVLLNRNR